MASQNYNIDTAVPSAFDVHYADVVKACGYQFLLFNMFEKKSLETLDREGES